MTLFSLFAILISVTALLAYANERWIRLPPTIGVLAASLMLSIVLVSTSYLGLDVSSWAEHSLQRIDFDLFLMKGLLSFLLFAGALHVDLSSLLERKGTILTLATVGVVTSTLIIGYLTWYALQGLGYPVPLLYALLFGALITPTDPIAVLAMLKTAKTSSSLKAMIAGESLFNDGVGVVVFTLLLSLVVGGHDVGALEVAELFVVEALGGALLGLALGYIAYRMLRRIDQYTVEILITLSLVMGGYALAGAMHSSGPIAMVVAGLFIGNHGRAFGMSEETREHLDTFWELLDEILNAVLFVFIGLELLVLKLELAYFLIALLLIPVVLLTRFVSVGVPIALMRRKAEYPSYTVTMLTWCGVRGGISVALALSLPAGRERDLILVLSYVIVIFSILVQGLSVGKLARWVARKSS